MAPAQPNIVLINCDDLGYGDLGCYGSSVHRTPRVDQMAAEGLRFTDFYMASPVCSPSRASMLTGSYPLRLGFGPHSMGGGVLFPGHEFGLNPSEVTIASLLRDAGYATSLVGKWHLGDQPEFLPAQHGFDEYFGIPYSNDMGRQVAMEGMPPWEEMIEKYDLNLPAHRPPLPLLNGTADGTEVVEAQPDQAELTSRYIDRSHEFITRQAAADKPFFLYFAHMYVHLPIYVQQHFLDRSQNGPYGAAVESIDHALGELLDLLGALGIDDNTLVIFLSDNGALVPGDGPIGSAIESHGSNAPLRGSKGGTWDGGQRVPCIMRWPDKIQPTESMSVTTAMDLYPTLARIGGADLPTDRVIDGVDLPWVGGDPAPDTATEREPFFFMIGGNINAVRSGRWKLHTRRRGARFHDSDEVLELYDLVADIGETIDVAADNPATVAEMMALIETARADLGDELLGIEGAGVRPIGISNDPKPLTTYDPDHPYFMAEYDLADRG